MRADNLHRVFTACRKARHLEISGILLAAVASLTVGTSIGANSMPVAGDAVASNPDGESALDNGDYKRAESVFRSALAQSHNSAAEAGMRTGLGEALLWQGNFSEASSLLNKAKNQMLKGSTENQLRILDDLAWLAEAQNKNGNALELAQQAVEIARSNKTDTFLFVTSLTHLAYLQEQLGSLDKAKVLYEEAMTAESKAQTPRYGLIADIQDKLGAIYRKLGDAQRSQQCYQQSLGWKMSLGMPLKSYEPHPYWNDIVFRFHDGAPNCLRKFENGAELLIVTANGVTVAASLPSRPSDLVKAGQVYVVARNESQQSVQFLPQQPTLFISLPKAAYLHPIDAANLANKIEKKGEKKAKWIRFWGENATQSVTTTMIGNGGFYGYPPIYSYGGAMPFVSRSGDMTTMITQVPDYAAQARALQKAADVSGKAQATAQQVREQTIGATTLSPGQEISGSLFFATDKITKATLLIPVGNSTFEFQFPGS